MCFKTLPVEFDERGNATLRGGIPDPYDVTVAKPDLDLDETERRRRSSAWWPGTGTSRTSTWTRSPASPAPWPCT